MNSCFRHRAEAPTEPAVSPAVAADPADGLALARKAQEQLRPKCQPRPPPAASRSREGRAASCSPPRHSRRTQRSEGAGLLEEALERAGMVLDAKILAQPGVLDGIRCAVSGVLATRRASPY